LGDTFDLLQALVRYKGLYCVGFFLYSGFQMEGEVGKWKLSFSQIWVWNR